MCGRSVYVWSAIRATTRRSRQVALRNGNLAVVGRLNGRSQASTISFDSLDKFL